MKIPAGGEVPELVDSQRRRSAAERRRYSENRAQRTAGGDKHRTPWSIDDARTALDVSLTVTEAALEVGRSAVAVERLRAKWRASQLPAGLADQVPPPPRAGTPPPTTRSRS